MGILGPNGRGVYDHYELNSERLFYAGTLAKAFGGFGGIVPGNQAYIQQLRQGDTVNGGSYFAAAAAASLAGIRWVKRHPEARTQLRHNARYLKMKLRNLGLLVEDNDIPMASWTQGNAEAMRKIQQALLNRRIAIQYCHYVGTGNEGVLRAVVFSTHTEAQIDQLIDNLEAFL